jgi:hypothetical protein
MVTQTLIVMGSVVQSPAFAPLAYNGFLQSNVLPLGGGVAVPHSAVLPTSVLSTPFVPHLPPAVNPVVSRAAVPAFATPSILPAVVPVAPRTLFAGGYSVASPFLPAPVALQARSVHAVAPAVVPAISRALPPIALATR